MCVIGRVVFETVAMEMEIRIEVLLGTQLHGLFKYSQVR